MQNLAQNKTESKIFTNYQLLHKKLDDQDFAREFTKKQTGRAQELISQILMVTSGVSEVIGTQNEWGHANLLELLDIFQIRHDNFSRSDLAEDLQMFVYTYSINHGESYRRWKTGHYQERGLDEDGIEIAAPTEEQTAVPAPLDLSACPVEDLSQKLSDIMRNPNLPERLHNCLSDELTDLCAGQIGELMNSPASIAKAFSSANGGQSDEGQ